MEKFTSLQRLEALVAGETSTWLQDAEARLANEAWLDRSSEIAIAVLFTIDDINTNQRELAEKMGVSPQYLNKILRGKENLTLETISKLEKALGIVLIEINKYT